MALYCSPIGISLGGTALLVVDDILVGLPKYGCSVAGEDAAYIRAEFAAPMGRGNQLNVITFTRLKEYADQEEAIIGARDWQASFPKAGELSLGGAVYPSARFVSGGCEPSERSPLLVEETYTIHYGQEEEV